MWEPGLVGVSDGVMSVISDYCRPAPPLLRGYSPDIQRNKFLKLDRCCDTLYESFKRSFTIAENAATRAFSWLKAPTSDFTFKTLLRHYAKRTLNPQ